MPSINDFEPSWMDDGGGLSGGAETSPDFEFEQSYLLHGSTVSAASWETQTTSRQNQSPEDTSPARGCIPASPPDTGTWVWGTVDGECQWIDTTACS